MAGRTVQLQIVDVRVVDELEDPVDLDDESYKGESFLSAVESSEEHRFPTHCTTLVFGCTQEGQSVLLRIEDFEPVIYYSMEKHNKHQILQHLETEARLRKAESFKCDVVMRANTYGWEPDPNDPSRRKEHRYLKVYFPTIFAFKRARWVKSTMYVTHESWIPLETQFLEAHDIFPSGWMEVRSAQAVRQAERISHCAIELSAHQRNIHYLQSDRIAPLMVASIDIECISGTGAMPDEEKPEDPICMIGIVLWRFGRPVDEVRQIVYVVGACAQSPEMEVRVCSDETDLLASFRHDFVREFDPDLMLTYNGFGFDWKYMCTRATKILGCREFMFLDRLVARKCKVLNKELNSSALGDNDLYIVDIGGRSHLDLMKWVQANRKRSSYKLDDVASDYLGDQKVEMDYKQMFMLAQGSEEEKLRVAIYCAKDCWLLIALAVKLAILFQLTEMSRVTKTILEWLNTKGQMVKVHNQLAWAAHRFQRRDDGTGGHILNTPVAFSGSPDDNYQGATVIDAVPSFYTDPIATLDFMSLYPSIIMANNFCMSTLVQDPSLMNLPNVEYVVIEVAGKRYVWAPGIPGVIPMMVENLLRARKGAKRAMNAATTDEEKSVQNARQLALKVSANSIYGFTGAVKMGKYFCLAIADCVTYRAREMLQQTVEWAKEFAPCDVVYGDTDSIMVRFKDKNTVEEAAEIAERAADHITARFPDKIVLEFEKVYHPYLLLKKKKYAGLMYERNKEGKMEFTKLDAKGIELVRRDNCPAARMTQKNVLDKLMYERSVDSALEALRADLKLLVDNKIPLDDYIITKSLRKKYKNEDQAHLCVAQKMRERLPGSEPKTGDRVPYVLLEHKNPKAKASERAEDVGYARERQLCVDRLYYLEHQIENPVSSLLIDILGSALKAVFEPFKITLRLQMQNQSTLEKHGFRVIDKTTSTAKPNSSLEDAMIGLSSRSHTVAKKRAAPRKPAGPRKK